MSLKCMYWKTVWLAYWYLYFLSVPHLCSYWLQMDIFCFYFYIPGLEFLPLHFIRQLLASDTQSEFFIGQFPFSNLGAEIALNRGCQMHITRFELYMNLHNGFCRFVLGYLCAFGLPFVLSLFRWLNQILLNPWWKQYALWVVTAEIMFSLHGQLEAVTCKNSSPGTLNTGGDGNVGTLDVPPGHKWSLCIHGAWHYKWQSVCRKVICSKTLSTLL